MCIMLHSLDLSEDFKGWGFQYLSEILQHKKRTHNVACFILACVQNGTRRIHEGRH